VKHVTFTAFLYQAPQEDINLPSSSLRNVAVLAQRLTVPYTVAKGSPAFCQVCPIRRNRSVTYQFSNQDNACCDAAMLRGSDRPNARKIQEARRCLPGANGIQGKVYGRIVHREGVGGLWFLGGGGAIRG
jgi:hypothetical protein